MTVDDDLLRRWAASTDPERDPITGAEVREHTPVATIGAVSGPPPERRLRVLVAAVIVLLAGAALVVGVVRRDSDRTVRTGTTTTPAVEAGTGQLVVTNDVGDRAYADMGPLSPESAVGLTQVLRGEEVVAEVRGWDVSNDAVLSERLPAGTYQVKSWEISSCEGGCKLDDRGILEDPSDLGAYRPEDACTTEVTVRPDATTTVEMRRGLDDAENNDACGFAIGTPTRVVVAAGLLPSGYEGVIHRFELVADGEVIAAGPVTSESTALVLDRPIPPGSYAFRFENYDCPGSCPRVGPDGRPVDDPNRPLRLRDCGGELPVEDRPAVVVITIEGSEASSTCKITQPDNVPSLTIPPAWSLQTRLPTTCGSDYLHRVSTASGSPVDPKGARQCFLQAYRDRAPMEQYTIDSTQPRLVIWRTRGGRFQVIRPGQTPEEPWTKQNCDLGNLPEPEWVGPTGCGAEQPLPYVR